jgi:rubrerythrin
MTNNNVEAILVALKSEKKAIEYYGRAARRIVNPKGKEALEKILKEEKKHFDQLKRIYKHTTHRDLNEHELEHVGATLSPLTEEHLADKEASDLEVCQIALKDEVDARAFYIKAADSAPDEMTKRVFLDLAKEEESHSHSITRICKILAG